MPDSDYNAVARELSDRIVEAQRGIRMLDAINWGDEVRDEFLAAKGERPPRVDASTYKPLRIDVPVLRERFAELDRDIEARIGRDDPAGRLMLRMCREYDAVLAMLEARGTPDFARLSAELFGRAGEPFHAGGPSLVELASLLDEALGNIDESAFLDADEREFDTERAVEVLQSQLDQVFPAGAVHVRPSDGIVADAAAGSDYIKLRERARFSRRDLRVLEVHEGWVHVGTTLNGALQPVCTFLSKGTPSTTITQEGLALFIEVISFSSHPKRLRRVTDRIRGIHWAEQGAGFVEVWRRFREEGRSDVEAYGTTQRVFRGSTPDGGPFTKDLSYSRGFVEIYNFIRLAVRRGRLDRIPLLFCGKLRLHDLDALADLFERGVVIGPRFLPPPLVDLSALTAWMAYSNFLNRLDLAQIEEDFTALLAP